MWSWLLKNCTAVISSVYDLHDRSTHMAADNLSTGSSQHTSLTDSCLGDIVSPTDTWTLSTLESIPHVYSQVHDLDPAVTHVQPIPHPNSH